MTNEDLRAAAMVGAATAVADIAKRLHAVRANAPPDRWAALDAAMIVVAKTSVVEVADRVVSMRRAGAAEVSRG